MFYLQLFVLFLTLTCVLFLIIGLVKPWSMLWWEDVQNRMKVIKAYGTLSVVFGLLYVALRIFYPE